MGTSFIVHPGYTIIGIQVLLYEYTYNKMIKIQA